MELPFNCSKKKQGEENLNSTACLRFVSQAADEEPAIFSVAMPLPPAITAAGGGSSLAAAAVCPQSTAAVAQ